VRQAEPILLKELRGRMRGARAFILLTFYLLVLGGLMGFIVWVGSEESSGDVQRNIGRLLFGTLAAMQMLLVAFLAPAFTSSAISREHEALTYDMLMATPISPVAVVIGKLVAALSYLLLLIFTTLPLAALATVFGGVTPGDLVRMVTALVIAALLFGMVGLFSSALTRRTGCATVIAYLGVLLILGGGLIAAFLSAFVTRGDQNVIRFLVAGSPLMMLFALIPEAENEVLPWGLTAGWSLLLTSILGGATTMMVAAPGLRRPTRRLIGATLLLMLASILIGALIVFLESSL
jgi:ABC-2 type transport system permease protein